MKATRKFTAVNIRKADEDTLEQELPRQVVARVILESLIMEYELNEF